MSTTIKLTAPVQEVIEFAVSWGAISKAPGGRFRLKRGMPILLHTMGYYASEPRSSTPRDRLAHVVEALQYIHGNLTS